MPPGNTINILYEKEVESSNKNPIEIPVELLEHMACNKTLEIIGDPEFLASQEYKINAQSPDGQKYVCFSKRRLIFSISDNTKKGNAQTFFHKKKATNL